MDLATFRWLLSTSGQRALAVAAQLPLRPATYLGDLERLRRDFGAEHGAALVETIQLRRQATAKFELAEQMYFTREALEQASGGRVARHTAARYAARGRVADIGCGIGGDLLALARVTQVVAIDRDLLRLSMARANAAAHGLDNQIRFICTEVTDRPPPGIDALFVDPARRLGSARRFAPEEYQPPLTRVTAWARRVAAVGVKVAPGIADAAVPAGWEAEFVADGAELKAALLWHGPLATTGRRATLLPDGLTLSGADAGGAPPLGPIGRYLYEPNAAIIRAHHLDQVAALIAGWQIDPSIAYLCTHEPQMTPLARRYTIDEWLPFGLKTLNRRLQALAVGRVTIKKRGSPLDPQTFERQLTLQGPAERTLVLTRASGKPVVLICQAS